MQKNVISPYCVTQLIGRGADIRNSRSTHVHIGDPFRADPFDLERGGGLVWVNLCIYIFLIPMVGGGVLPHKKDDIRETPERCG